MITLPIDAIPTMTAYVGQFATDLWPILALAIGVPLAFYVLRRVVGLAKVK